MFRSYGSRQKGNFSLASQLQTKYHTWSVEWCTGIIFNIFKFCLQVPHVYWPLSRCIYSLKCIHLQVYLVSFLDSFKLFRKLCIGVFFVGDWQEGLVLIHCARETWACHQLQWINVSVQGGVTSWVSFTVQLIVPTHRCLQLGSPGMLGLRLSATYHLVLTLLGNCQVSLCPCQFVGQPFVLNLYG